jgi:hypothetical protein
MAQVCQGIAAFRAPGTVLYVPYLCTVLADVAAHLGHLEDGLQALAEAHTLMEQHEERFWEIEHKTTELTTIAIWSMVSVCKVKRY